MAEFAPSFDVLIIGGGPAGLSAALWCDELGLTAILFERENEFGGQLTRVFNPIENYLGVTAQNGQQLRDVFLKQIADRKFVRSLSCEIIAVDPDKMTVTTADGKTFSGRSIIIATGVRRRELGVPGEKEFRGKGILESGKRDAEKVKDKRVLVVGGGDAALENALILSEYAEKVVVAHRGAGFSAREEFIKEARSRKNVEFLLNTTVIEIAGETSVSKVNVKNLVNGNFKALNFDVVLVRIGVSPNVEGFSDFLGTDEKGYLKIDWNCLTTCANIYAIGDVANSVSPTIAGAVGTGASAVKSILEQTC